MPYKCINVDGKNFEYILGKHNLKVKGLGVFSRTEKDIHSEGRVVEIIRETCIKDKEMNDG